ncbi:hypothetical protein A4X09_0g4247 [Tilletia walkeri]|uniref:Uncharacterized protein n=1 Tax=Tilletia walkeri TaxID=117179 RepID=A0A8X7N9S3_9BASI|nr:hypothetical protein A4X09_0g4247 [Tilletia walkeri]
MPAPTRRGSSSSPPLHASTATTTHSRSSTGGASVSTTTTGSNSATRPTSRRTGSKTSTATVAGIRALLDATGASSTVTSPVASLAAFFTPASAATDARGGSHAAVQEPASQQPPLSRYPQEGSSLGSAPSTTSAMLPGGFNAPTSLLLGPSTSTAPSIPAARVAIAYGPGDPLSPRQGSEHGFSQDGSQGQEAASQDSFSSYIHKNPGIVASSQSSHGSHSRSPSSSPPRNSGNRAIPGTSQSGVNASGLDAVREESQASQALGWPSQSPSNRSAALARHFAGSSQPSNASASSHHGSSPPPTFATAAFPSVSQPGLSVLADISNNDSFANSSSSAHFTDTSFAFSSVSHPHSMYAHEDNSMTTVGSASDASMSLLNKGVITSQSDSRFSEDADASQVHEDLPASQETLAATSFARQTSFRSFMGASWPDIVHAQHRAAASVLAPPIPIQARTINSRKRPRAETEEASHSGTDQSLSSSGTEGKVVSKVLTQTDAVADLRSRIYGKKSKAGSRRTSRIKGRKSRKSASPSFEQTGFQGYRALTLNTSSSGRAVLGLRTRAYETVAVNTTVARTFWGPSPLPSPPPEQDVGQRQLSHQQMSRTQGTDQSVLERGIPLQLRKSLRSTAELLAPHRQGEGGFIYGSMQEWAHSEELASPPPESLRQKTADAVAAIESASSHQMNAGHQGTSIFLSEEDKIKLYAGSKKGTPMSPLKPNPAALGLLKPPTPSKAQYVFSAAKYDNVLGRSGNVAPLRCASAPGGISLRFKKCASAFTALRVVLSPLPPTDSVQVVAKRQCIARGFYRTPSLDAVMQRGDVLDRDEGHAPAPTPPQKPRRVRKKKAKVLTTVRESTPVSSPSKRAQRAGNADEVDELLCQSEGESDVDLCRAVPGSSLHPATALSSDEDDDEDDDDDEASRFALSSDHYDMESSISGVPMPVRVKRRFGSAAPGYRGAFHHGPSNLASSAHQVQQQQHYHTTDADGFRRPGAPLGAGASGSAQRRSMFGGGGGHEDGEGLHRTFSRFSSAGQLEGRRTGFATSVAARRRPTGDETAEQQHAAAELLLAFGQRRE